MEDFHGKWVVASVHSLFISRIYFARYGLETLTSKAYQ
jgi:hypothetical protein